MSEDTRVRRALDGIPLEIEEHRRRLDSVVGLQDADSETLTECVEALHAIAARVEELEQRVRALETPA